MKFCQDFTKAVFNKKWLISCQNHLHRANSFFIDWRTNIIPWGGIDGLLFALTTHLPREKGKGKILQMLPRLYSSFFELEHFLSGHNQKQYFIMFKPNGVVFSVFWEIIRTATTAVFWEKSYSEYLKADGFSCSYLYALTKRYHRPVYASPAHFRSASL